MQGHICRLSFIATGVNETTITSEKQQITKWAIMFHMDVWIIQKSVMFQTL